MAGNKSLLSNIKSCQKDHVTYGDGKWGKILGKRSNNILVGLVIYLKHQLCNGINMKNKNTRPQNHTHGSRECYAYNKNKFLDSNLH